MTKDPNASLEQNDVPATGSTEGINESFDDINKDNIFGMSEAGQIDLEDPQDGDLNKVDPVKTEGDPIFGDQQVGQQAKPEGDIMDDPPDDDSKKQVEGQGQQAQQTQQQAQPDDSQKPAETTPETTPTDPNEQQPQDDYKPDFKYKFLDEEREFPENIRPLIKNKDQENVVRDLLSRSDGLEVVLDSRERMKKDYEELNKLHSETQNKLKDHQRAWDEVKYYKQTNNLSSLFKRLGISNQQLNAHMDEQYRYETADVNERAQIERQRLLQERNFNDFNEQQRLRDENEKLQAQMKEREDAEKRRNEEMQLQAQTRVVNEINQGIHADAGIKKFADEYNKRAGIADKFQRDVFANGYYMSNTTGRVPTGVEALQFTLKTLGYQNGQAGPAQPTPSKKTIPTIKGSDDRFILNTQVKSREDQERLLKSLASGHF